MGEFKSDFFLLSIFFTEHVKNRTEAIKDEIKLETDVENEILQKF